MKYSWLLSFFFLASFSLFGQIKQPVKWSFESKQVSASEFDLVFKAKVEKGWKIYSVYQEYGDDVIGPTPTAFYLDEGAHFEPAGKIKESGARKSEREPLFDNLKVAFFKGDATFTQRVKVRDFSQPVTGYLEYMACDDEMCLPPANVDFSFSLSPAGESAAAPPAGTAPASASSSAPTPSSETSTPAAPPAPSLAIGGAGMATPVQWVFESNKISDTEYELRFTAQMDRGWSIYSQHTDPNDGPIPTEFNFEAGSHFALLGDAVEEGKKKTGPDPYFGGAIVSKFVDGSAVFTQKVTAADPQQPIKGYLVYMACDDEQCLPPMDVEFEFNLAAGTAGIAAFDPASGLRVIDQTVPMVRQTYIAPLGNCGSEDTTRDSNLLWTFILGFAGGLLALLTPCVFPMVPLTVSFFTKSSKDRKSSLRNALLFGSSIIVIYVAIGLFITGVFGATALNELSTNWIANVLFFLIFLFFAFSFFGYYELTLPSSWTNKSDNMAERGGLIGIFFMAFTLALVSFSCTGPIIGTALVQSATDKLGPFVVMLGFSSALALPFGLFAAFPGWLNSLPKSGGWMNSVKVVLGFLELALALKFLSVADMTMHWGILPYEVFMAAWILIFAAMAAYLFGYIRFPHDSPVKKLSIGRGSLAFLTLGLTVYLVTGFFFNEKTQTYNSLKLMSGLAPPSHYNIFLPEPEVDPLIKAKYPSFTKCANDLDCFKDYEEGLAYARETKKPVLLDFTGYGCVNCRKMEEHVWVDDRVWQRLAQEFVLISLYVDDRKPLEEVLLSLPRQEKLRNVGNKWSDFQIVNFEQNSQPLYVMMAPDERVLAAPRGYKEGVGEYIQYLDCGLDIYLRLSETESDEPAGEPLGIRE
jgi:thiol:disulfide interchange protein DsbD